MEKYLGVKVIEAKPMKRELDNQDGYQVVYEDGYTSWSPKDVFEKAYRKIRNISDLKIPHNNYEVDSFQWRVISEVKELKDKIGKLSEFMNFNSSPEYMKLPNEEKLRLRQQLMAMKYYLTILIERIESFK